MADGDTGEKTPILKIEKNIDGDAENVHIIKETEFKIYKRRWYVLFVFVLCSMASSIVTNGLSALPIAGKRAFGWSTGDFALLQSWSFGMPTITGFGVFWLMNRKGIRWAMVVCMTFNVVGAAIRCITFKVPYVTLCLNIGQAISGVSCSIAFGGASLLAASWFPQKERLIATAIGTNAFFCGNFFVNIMTILAVTTREEVIIKNVIGEGVYRNTTINQPSLDLIFSMTNRIEIMKVMYVQCGFAAFAFILLALYFPSKPANPPDRSATVDRLDFKEGLRTLFTQKTFVILLVIYSFVQSVGLTSDSLFNIIGNVVTFNEKRINYLSVFIIVMCLLCVPSAMVFLQYLHNHLQLFLAILYVFVAFLQSWVLMMLLNIFPRKFFLNFAFPSTLLAIFRQTAIPVFMQLTCNAVFPVNEGVVTGIMFWGINPVALILLLLFEVPNIGIIWLLITQIIVTVMASVGIKLVVIPDKKSEVDESHSIN